MAADYFNEKVDYVIDEGLMYEDAILRAVPMSLYVPDEYIEKYLVETGDEKGYEKAITVNRIIMGTHKANGREYWTKIVTHCAAVDDEETGTLADFCKDLRVEKEEAFFACVWLLQATLPEVNTYMFHSIVRPIASQIVATLWARAVKDKIVKEEEYADVTEIGFTPEEDKYYYDILQRRPHPPSRQADA